MNFKSNEKEVTINERGVVNVFLCNFSFFRLFSVRLQPATCRVLAPQASDKVVRGLGPRVAQCVVMSHVAAVILCIQ